MLGTRQRAFSGGGGGGDNNRAKPLDFRASDGEDIRVRDLSSPPPPPPSPNKTEWSRTPNMFVTLMVNRFQPLVLCDVGFRLLFTYKQKKTTDTHIRHTNEKNHMKIKNCLWGGGGAS